MGKPYSQELDRILATLIWAEGVALAPTNFLTFHYQSERLVCLGSGGSFSAAEFAARVAEDTLGTQAVAVTPMEYVQRVRGFGPHTAFLLSAEGKNSDIRMAAAAALSHARHTTALTFRKHSPLTDLMAEDDGAAAFGIEPPWDKDGYLATNSLVASLVLIARWAGLTMNVIEAGQAFTRYRQDMAKSRAVASLGVGARVLAVHGARGAVAAIDLESKFAESAFGTVQRTDLRQFAHGRHIQLTQSQDPFVVVAFITSDELDLWVAQRHLLPASTEVMTCLTPSGLPDAALHGTLFVFALVEALGRALGRDAGEPPVPGFARDIHAMEASRYLALPSACAGNAKVAVLRRTGHLWSTISQAMDAFAQRLRDATVRGLVLDFDGTCCETRLRLKGMDDEVTQEIRRLLAAGLHIAFASGRGDSLYAELRERLEPSTWERVLLGCHSGSTRVRLSDPWLESARHSEFAVLDEELRAQGIGPDAGYRIRAKGGQYTIECSEVQGARRAFLLASEAVRTRPGWRAFRSSHSVDILADTAGKLAVVEWLATDTRSDASTQLLRVGDRGEMFGNDRELLGSGLSLSVDGVSPDLDACWLFGDEGLAASQRAVEYLRSLEMSEPNACRINAEAIDQWLDSARDSLHRKESASR